MQPIDLIQQNYKELFEKYGAKLYKKTLTELYEELIPRPLILYRQTAMEKINALVKHSTIEIGWHGTVNRVAENTFIIEDIFVYPQTCSSATVTTDDLEYTNWLHSLPPVIFERLRFQGHSHVNMGVGSSSTDDKFYTDLTSNLKPNDFYIFGIYNKRNDINIMMQDNKTENIYNHKQIDQNVLIGAETSFEYAKRIMDTFTRTSRPSISTFQQQVNFEKKSKIEANKKQKELDKRAKELDEQYRRSIT